VGYQLSQPGIRHGFQDVWSLFLIIDADASQLSFYFFFTQQNATLQKIQRISSSNKKQGEEKHLFQKVICVIKKKGVQN